MSRPNCCCGFLQSGKDMPIIDGLIEKLLAVSTAKIGTLVRMEANEARAERISGLCWPCNALLPVLLGRPTHAGLSAAVSPLATVNVVVRIHQISTVLQEARSIFMQQNMLVRARAWPRSNSAARPSRALRSERESHSIVT